MRMRIVSLSIFVLLLTLAFALGVYAGSAGNPEPPAPPDLTSSYTLEDIYNRLDTGAAGSQEPFTEPASDPGIGTMHTLDELYDLIGERAPVPKTGQTTKLADGDDGDLEKGVAWPYPRFTIHDNGTPQLADDTVTDNLTGLMWTRNAKHQAKKWYDSDAGDYPALEYCSNLELARYRDWRLPNVRELHSLIDFSQFSPALPSGHPFTDVQDAYWSSTTLAISSNFAWLVDLGDGNVYNGNIFGTSYVWPVRGGQ
jgi:hypothetical protein